MENQNPLYGAWVHSERFTLDELIDAELNLSDPIIRVDLSQNYPLPDKSPEADDRRLAYLKERS